MHNAGSTQSFMGIKRRLARSTNSTLAVVEIIDRRASPIESFACRLHRSATTTPVLLAGIRPLEGLSRLHACMAGGVETPSIMLIRWTSMRAG